jgi:hypothetical protein
MANSAADSPLFFSLALDPASACIGAASTRNPVGRAHGVSYDQRTISRRTFSRGLEAAARSSSLPSNRVPLESGTESFAAIPSIPQSKQEVVPNGLRQATTRDPKIPCTVQSSDRRWGGSHASCVRYPSPIVPDRIPKRRASVDTTEHPASSSVASPTDDAVGMTNAMSS